MLKAAKQITNEEYASCADFMRGVSGLDQLRNDPTTALSGGATGAEREALLAQKLMKVGGRQLGCDFEFKA